ncbi:MAG: arylesterase [Nitrospiria bacterium]
MKNNLNVFIWMMLFLIMITPAEGSQDTGKPSPRLIVAFGDSLTAGYGVALAEAYPALLEQKLKKENYPYRVLNAGISGDTTTGGLARINEVIKQKPEIVILELGANDGLRGTRLDIIQNNLSQMIERLRKKKIKVLLAGMKLPPNYGPEYTAGFHRIYLSVSKKYRIPVIPFFLEGTAIKESLNQADGLHPTPEGYKIVTDNLWPYLIPLLSR